MVEGRSSGSRINLVFAPSHLNKTKQWYLQISSPTTAAGPLPVYTGFPVKPFWAPWSNQIQNILVAVNKKLKKKDPPQKIESNINILHSVGFIELRIQSSL